MIEKLPFTQIHTGGEDMVDRVEIQPVAPYEMQHKINELVEVVNAMQNLWFEVATVKKIILELQTRAENAQDEFAVQRKWIGKLCKFWDYDGEEKWFSILEHIDKNSPYTYCASGDWWYKHCEPVKPDDDIIYKGGE